MQQGVDRTQERLALLVRAGEMFHRSLDVDETLDNVARMAVESFADICLFDLMDEQSDRLYVTAGAHRDPRLDKSLKNLGSTILYASQGRLHPALHVTQTGESFFIPVVDEAAIQSHAVSREHAEFMRRMGYRSKVVVPVVAHGRSFGALTFVRTRESEPFDQRDVQAAEELGRRAGLAIANAKQYHREQYVAETLQRAFLLRELPNRPGLTIHALYRAALGEAELGGDWYDAFRTADESTVVTIGDVAGKGIEAARLMVQLRQSVRAASTVTQDPGEILRIVNETLLFDRTDALATAFVAVVRRDLHAIRWSSAGHPPALLRRKDGRIEKLAADAPPLGIERGMKFGGQDAPIDEGDLLALYTDGILEVTRDPIAGEAILDRVVASKAATHAANPARYVERALQRERPHDDVAIMTLHFGQVERNWRFDVGDPGAAYAIKRELLASIGAASAATPGELLSTELILSELIGNAVRHAPGPLSLSLSVEDGQVVLHMIDEGPGFDLRAELPKDVWSESGRGLFLISAIACGVEAERLPGYGSYIRVILPVTPRGRNAGGETRSLVHSR
ncbi:MAG: SpoIIE family protein phosphatase [Candidatus Eremiobacteraeota bacterium]|nr:SpoIIE family protein phosphatase [Candidatus Eremiobacteraeota bacterium]